MGKPTPRSGDHNRTAAVEHRRTTEETDVSVSVDFVRTVAEAESEDTPQAIETSLPFLDHILRAFSLHGGFFLRVSASGDLHVDPHHVVEDVGIVLGEALSELRERGPIARYGHAIIPMDDALSEVVVDSGGRPYLVYQAELPQPYAGDFDLSLIREFLLGLATRGKMNIHAHCRYGENSHHMIEALFKALGRAVAMAYRPRDDVQSTKGTVQ